MGQSDAIRGVSNGGKTATEVSVAQDNASTRVQLLQRHWRRGVRTALEKIGWYLFTDPAIAFHVGTESPRPGQPAEGLFLGGIQDGQQDMNWTDYNLSIEPMSMQRVDPQRQQQIAQMVLNVAVEIGPLIAQFRWVRWRSLLDTLGEALNIEGLYDQVIDEQALLQAMSLGMALPIPGAPQQAAGSVPPNANPQLRAMFGGMMGAPLAGQPAAPQPMIPTAQPVASRMPAAPAMIGPHAMEQGRPMMAGAA
jgi:hypothetical protein